MKKEIDLVLKFAGEQISKNPGMNSWVVREAFRIEIGKIRGVLYYIRFIPYANLVSDNLDAPQYSHMGGRTSGLNVAMLPLDFVKPIHDKLALVLQETCGYSGEAFKKIQQIMEFNDY